LLSAPGVERAPAPGNLPGFDVENDVATALAQGDGRAAELAFERLLLPLTTQPEVSVAHRYRLIALLGWCFGLAIRRGAVGDSSLWFAFDDLRQAATTSTFLLAFRARLPILTAALASVPRWSPEVNQAVSWVRTHFAQPLTLETVADELALSPKKLSRLLVDALGQGFSEFLIEVRLEHARALLVLPGASVKSVSIACGYSDPNYFSRLFKRQTGVTPREFANLDYSPDVLS
jgi:AraC-like DNA-binding protein